MQEIRFYHLQTSSLEQALPKLLEKTLERSQRAVVWTQGQEESESLADHLWFYAERSFLAHGTDKDGYSAHQPIWLTHREENPGGANYLFLTSAKYTDFCDGFEMVAILFQGSEQEEVSKARDIWRDLKQHDGVNISYWKQEENGRWSKKPT